MYETLKRLYSMGKLTQVQLDNAIVKGWITEEEKTSIIGE